MELSKPLHINLGVDIELGGEEGEYKVSIKLLNETGQSSIIIQFCGKSLDELLERVKLFKELIARFKSEVS